jgi:predicted nucleic acid-binding protein
MKMRTVIDTGVAVSAVLLPRSVPRQAFDAAAARGTLLVSEETIAELDEVLRQPSSPAGRVLAVCFCDKMRVCGFL